MSHPDTWYAYFHLRGSFNPAEITERVGITPTKSVTAGELGHSGRPVPCSRWELRSRLGDTEDLEAQVVDVLDQLDANRNGFIELSREFGGTMQLVGYFKEREPGVHFEREVILRIAEYGLCIDCDFYNRS